MLAFSKAKRTAVTGYAFAAAGIILYAQLDRIVDLRMGDDVLNGAVVGAWLRRSAPLLLPLSVPRFGARRTLTLQKPLRSPLQLELEVQFLSDSWCEHPRSTRYSDVSRVVLGHQCFDAASRERLMSWR
jgi:hypothetical protein